MWCCVAAQLPALFACSRSHSHRECVCHSVHLLYSFVSPFISSWFDHLRIQNPLNNLKPQQKQFSNGSDSDTDTALGSEGRHQIIWAARRHTSTFAPSIWTDTHQIAATERKRQLLMFTNMQWNGYKYSASSVLLIILSVHACKRWTSLNLLRLMAFDLPLCIHISLDAIRWLCSTDSIKLYFASKH